MRLRSVLVLAIVSLLLSTVLLVAGNAYVSARRSAEKLSEEVLSQAGERIERTVESHLRVAVSESAFMKQRFDRHELVPDEPDRIARSALDVISSHPTLNYVSFSRESTGELAQASRNEKGEIEVRFLRRHGDSLDLTDFAPTPNGLTQIREELHKNANDPRPRPFYVAARNASKSVWTETYAFIGSNTRLGSAGVTLATPVRDAAGALLGVLTADFDLAGISKALNDLDLFEHGAAFIVEYRKDGSRVVIAHPTVPVLIDHGAAGVAAVSIDEINDPRVIAFAKALPATLPPHGKEMTRVDFDHGGAKYLAGFDRLDEEVPWIVCTMVPEDDLLADVHRNERTTFLITILGTLVAFGLALWIGARIANPLRLVADETEGIGQFRLDARPLGKAAIVEVQRLSVAVEEMKRNLRSFKKYVPAEVVRDLVSTGEEAKVGGKRKLLTIHFSDIAGFTSIAETMDAERLVVMLGEYLDEMTKPILASGGTIDKYIGDAIMAFWGAPREDEHHALHACEAALANRDRLARLNEEWEKEGRPRFDARAALHTGEVIVGNIGTGERFDYTIIGDAVNLASRLEGLNKLYGTDLMISESTYALVKDKVVARPLDQVAVKGKAKAVTVYELVGMKGKVDATRANRHAEAFAHYVARRFDQAATIFRPLAADDKAAKVLLDRCEELIEHPPSDDWEAVSKVTTK